MKQWRQVVAKNWLLWVVNIGAAVPLLWLAWDYWLDNLSVNPIDDLTNRTGKPALILLLLSLSVTPLNTILAYGPLVKTRKWLGLWAFLYASVHFLVFVGLDYGFSLRFIIQDGLASKPYIILGFLALLILLPLAITSTKGWMRRLGRNWKRLHRWVYAAGILAALHYVWVSKVAGGEPAIYTGILALLLVVRIPMVRKQLAKLRIRRHGRRSRQMEGLPKAGGAIKSSAAMKA